MWTAPIAWDDLRAPVSLAEAQGPCAFRATVKSSAILPLRGRRGLRVILEGDGCKVQAFWFYLAQGIRALAQPGTEVIGVGNVADGKVIQPDLLLDTPENHLVRARYPRMGPNNASLRKALAAAPSPDPVPAAIAQREGMPPAEWVLDAIHCRNGREAGEHDRIAFSERLAWVHAFAAAWDRLAAEGGAAPVLPVAKLDLDFGFRLTEDQTKAIAEIGADLAKKVPMRRLLLGDVGTGKTAVAIAAIAQCVAAKKQALLLAPTTILAEQYAAAMKPLAARAKIAFVTGERKDDIDEADVVVGTHAVFDVELPRLALVVVDEQQRLGVAQRLALVRKGVRPHLLTLSATPIPRTLALALRGEIATSTLKSAPAGRPPVTTEVVSQADLDAVLERARATAARGERVLWVVPRIEEDDIAKVRAKSLPGSVLVHGKLKDKHAAMEKFRRGKSPILVGTTVIEVGLDVPEATLIVIEDADRFGLAQLHQLRGRVGRAARKTPDACVAIHREPLGETAKARLDAFVALHTGEEIARADLELRGAGDFGGTRQHGDEGLELHGDEGLEWLGDRAWPWLSRIEADARALRKADKRLAGEPVLASLVARVRHALALRTEAG